MDDAEEDATEFFELFGLEEFPRGLRDPAFTGASSGSICRRNSVFLNAFGLHIKGTMSAERIFFSIISKLPSFMTVYMSIAC